MCGLGELTGHGTFVYCRPEAFERQTPGFACKHGVDWRRSSQLELRPVAFDVRVQVRSSRPLLFQKSDARPPRIAELLALEKISYMSASAFMAPVEVSLLRIQKRRGISDMIVSNSIGLIQHPLEIGRLVLKGLFSTTDHLPHATQTFQGERKNRPLLRHCCHSAEQSGAPSQVGRLHDLEQIDRGRTEKQIRCATARDDALLNLRAFELPEGIRVEDHNARRDIEHRGGR